LPYSISLSVGEVHRDMTRIIPELEATVLESGLIEG